MCAKRGISVDNKRGNSAEKKEKLTLMTNPIVTIEMEDGGEIQIELYAETAPNTARLNT